MPLPTETGSKKYIIAERFFETGVQDHLCKLFVSNFQDFQVLSLYSDLRNELLAYKVIQQNSDLIDPWLETPFMKIQKVDFNPSFDIIPNIASENNRHNFNIVPLSPFGHLHYIEGVFEYNLAFQEHTKIYLFKQNSDVNILVFQNEKCMFSNSFTCKSDTEILYFVLNALEITNLDKNLANLYLDYNLSKDSSFVNFVKPYFVSVKSLQIPMDNPDPEVPFLMELLFPNYLLSLCE
jgi:hypothetical protein